MLTWGQPPSAVQRSKAPQRCYCVEACVATGLRPVQSSAARLPTMNSKPTTPIRCPWATNDLSIRYHDEEWGLPTHDDTTLFEFLILEGAQAGLSWDTILKK